MRNIQTAVRLPVTAVVFDFDGTLSTLRYGWEGVMEELMLDLIANGDPTDAIRDEVRAYIDESTGIQTIHQMKWLAQTIKRYGLNPAAPSDPWACKAAYDERLMRPVEKRIHDIETGVAAMEAHRVPGAYLLLEALRRHDIRIYAASGTDQAHVIREAKALGLFPYFAEIHGALPGSEDCSKEAVIKRLLEENDLGGGQIAVIGDGKVEIRLGRNVGARTLGIASNEESKQGMNEQKRKRLTDAGADCILGDFSDLRMVLAFLGLEHNPVLSFSGIATNSAEERTNLVTIQTMLTPGVSPVPQWTAEGFNELVDRIIAARRQGHSVILSMGAHVIKNNLSRYLIALMREGVITHLAGNGACSIHDFELAYLGGTSEDVPTAIEDGSFGMWEETGRWMNEALQAGYRNSCGYGESLALYIHENPGRFPNREDCVLYQAWKLGIPATYHIALGTDIIHQHPIVDFAAIGGTSGTDFHTMCKSVSNMDDGVYLNFGSSVIGPEVFLKALSISRNLGYQTFHITTANFDLLDLGDAHTRLGYEDPHYYYRPRKNIVNRPVSRGGKGWHFVGNHKQTLPNLYAQVIAKGGCF